jgi:GTP cyclohydrolase II
MALAMIGERDAGVLIYEQQEGRGIGLMAKLKAYELQDEGLDTVEANERLGFKADQREFALPAEILKALGVSQVRLLSNNPDKVAALERRGIKMVERVPEVPPARTQKRETRRRSWDTCSRPDEVTTWGQPGLSGNANLGRARLQWCLYDSVEFGL